MSRCAAEMRTLTIPQLEKWYYGDLHCHSNWNGGANSIEEMIKAAQLMGYQYLGITDHTKFLRIEQGLNEKKLAQQKVGRGYAIKSFVLL